MKEKNDFFKFDYILISITIICCIFGLIVISSAVNSFDNSKKFIIVQSAAFAIGFVAMIFVSLIDYDVYGKYAKYIYIGSILSLVAVLIFGTGLESNGAKSWIRFGSFGIQPAEIVKIGFIITFAKHLSTIKNVNKSKNLAVLVLHIIPIIGLIMLQPDFGTTMVFICIFAGMIFVAGLSYKYIFTAFIGVGLSIPVIWNLLKPYQKDRILVFLNPESDPLGRGYHVIQSKIAIGSGKIFGKGLYKGTQTQFGYLPVKHTDFIFGVIGEELGLAGCFIVIALLFTLVVRCIYVSNSSKDKFGSYICVGVAFMFMAHIFENIGMCVGLMPVTGIPLPFFSYAGSSLVTNLISIGLVLGVHKRCRRIIL
ncbi:MAG: rod shape-determining protein RodA [Ruminococcaceae bacterium]|nr:rod shape-determining protein RodA [Oscillospiraceae bacterium]